MAGGIQLIQLCTSQIAPQLNCHRIIGHSITVCILNVVYKTKYIFIRKRGQDNVSCTSAHLIMPRKKDDKNYNLKKEKGSRESKSSRHELQKHNEA